MGLACRSIKQDAAQRSYNELQPGSIVRMGLGSRHPILAPFGLLRFGAIELPVSSVSIIKCCRQVTAGGGGGRKRGCWIGLNPNECPKTHLEVHFGDVGEPFIHSGFAVARSEACNAIFGSIVLDSGFIYGCMSERIHDMRGARAVLARAVCNSPGHLSTLSPCRCARKASLAP